MARTALADRAAQKENASQLIRERFLSGQEFAVPQLAEEFGVTRGLVTAVLAKFKSQGYDVKSVSRPYNGRRMKHYSVRERLAPAEEQAAMPAEAPPTPELGQNLIVTLLALGPGGELRLGLRDGDKTFIATLDRVG